MAKKKAPSVKPESVVLSVGRRGVRVKTLGTTDHKGVISPREKQKAVLVDTSKCIACRACQVSCKRWNELPAEKTFSHGTYQNPPFLSPATYTHVKFNEVPGERPEKPMEWLFRKHQCMHCTEPVCVEVCPNKAIYKTALGPVIIDENKCKGHGICVQKCPWKVPKLDWSKGKVYKCVFCFDRVTEGLEPSCVKSCTSGALTFGPMPEIYEKAEKRVEELQDAYPDASVYGTDPEDFYGGLHYIYVLAYEDALYDLGA
jgi:formate dehydrogenase iron-sulfur subunit